MVHCREDEFWEEVNSMDKKMCDVHSGFNACEWVNRWEIQN